MLWRGVQRSWSAYDAPMSNAEPEAGDDPFEIAARQLQESLKA